MTFAEIETKTKAFSKANDELSELTREARAEIEPLKNKYVRRIKSSVEKVLSAKEELSEALEEAGELFVKPKTIVIAGVRIGFKKDKNKIVWDDDDKVVELIEKKLDEEQAEQLIKVEKKPIKDAIARLDAATQNKIGCRIEEGKDEVYIKPMDSEIEKFVNSLMKEAEVV